jgi:chromosome partitioning protein
MIVAVLGVAKTTTVATLGHALTRLKPQWAQESVLAVDLDPKAKLTSWIGGNDPFPTLPNGMVDPIELSRAGDLALFSLAGRTIKAKPERPFTGLRDALRGFAFQRILLDCPRSFDVLSMNAVCTADELLVSVTSPAMAVEALEQLRVAIDKLCVAGGLEQFPPVRFLLTRQERPGAQAVQELRERLARQSGIAVCETTIREAPVLAKCAARRQTIFDFAPGEAVAEDYAALAEELHRYCVREEPLDEA